MTHPRIPLSLTIRFVPFPRMKKGIFFLLACRTTFFSSSTSFGKDQAVRRATDLHRGEPSHGRIEENPSLDQTPSLFFVIPSPYSSELQSSEFGVIKSKIRMTHSESINLFTELRTHDSELSLVASLAPLPPARYRLLPG